MTSKELETEIEASMDLIEDLNMDSVEFEVNYYQLQWELYQLVVEKQFEAVVANYFVEHLLQKQHQQDRYSLAETSCEEEGN